MMSRNAYHLYGNFGEHFPTSGTGVTFFRTENSDGIEIYHLQNNGQFFAFSQEEAWHC